MGWMCGLVAPPCNATPGVATVQAAYGREAFAGGKLHGRVLKVLQTRCHDDGKNGFLCEATFASTTDASERLYFDIVAVARSGSAWELKSGLCKR